jgi:site-specific recombinase XerD
MLAFRSPYCAQQTGAVSRGVTLRAIQPAAGQAGDHPWLAAFLKHLRQEDLSPATVRGYRSDLQVFLRWHASPALEKLTPVDVMNYRRHLSGEGGLQPASINRKLEALRRFCRWAHRADKLRTNPAAEVKLARTVRDLRPVGLTEPEVNALLRAAGQSKHGLSKRNYALAQLLLQTGLRVSEAAALRIGDTMVRERAGSVKVRHGKGDKQREVPLNTSARRGLNVYLETRKPLRPADPLITSETGAAISVRSIQAVVSSLARRAKITRTPVTAHSMRHTFALKFLEKNPGKLVELAALLGHESLDTTAIYLRPSQEEMAVGVERSRLNAAE